MDLETAKARLVEEIDARAGLLLDVSHRIHAQPELCFDEHHAHDLLTGVLEDEGLVPERHACGLETAFLARAGTSGPPAAACLEDAALPAIGHACGHNIIAAAGLGAGLAAAALADEAGGRVLIAGSPAEEGGGGKVFMLEAGALDGVDAAMMVHPAGSDIRHMQAIAVQQLWVEYEGRAAHAAAAPHMGRNALDGAVLGYLGVAALRQHIRPDERVHGIFTRAGDKPNVVPADAAAQYYVRAADLRRLEELKPRVLACLEAGALAAGVELHHEWKEPAYADVRDNHPMGELYAANAARLGRDVAADPTVPVVGSTDMGNVSYAVPSIHPMIAAAPPDVSIHTTDFERCAGGPQGDRAVLDGAKAMAMTIADLWLDAAALEAARRAFRDDPAIAAGAR